MTEYKFESPGSLQIIDFWKKGNMVRFYMGYDLASAWGDDWDDAPYEHNAEKVSDEYVFTKWDVVFPFDSYVLEPADDWRNQGNSQWSKEDMKLRRVPCIIVVSPGKDPDGMYADCFSYWVGNERVKKFYFGDTINDFEGVNCLMTDKWFREVNQF